MSVRTVRGVRQERFDDNKSIVNRCVKSVFCELAVILILRLDDEVCNQETFGAALILATGSYLPGVFRISQTLKLSRFQALHQPTEKKKKST